MIANSTRLAISYSYFLNQNSTFSYAGNVDNLYQLNIVGLNTSFSRGCTISVQWIMYQIPIMSL